MHMWHLAFEHDLAGISALIDLSIYKYIKKATAGWLLQALGH